MRKQMFAISLGLVAALAATQSAYSQQQKCGPRDAVLKSLSQKYKESRRAIGLSPNNVIVELHASEETGTWTLTLSRPNGITCLVAAGVAFEALNEEHLVPSGSPI